MKKTLAVLLTAAILLCVAPLAGFIAIDRQKQDFGGMFPVANAAVIVNSGTCGAEGDGSDLAWTLDSEGTLTINGSGEIRMNYFDGWTDLKRVRIEQGVTSIGYRAFSSCTELNSITIPDSVTNIGENAFIGCTALKSVTIPDFVANIEKGVFKGCTGLTSVTIPDSVTNIGESAFEGCAELTSVAIPDRVTNIGRYAFLKCTKLKSIWIPESVTQIGESAFGFCAALSQISVAPNNAVFTDAGNCLIETETKTLILGCKYSRIPADGSVTSVGDAAFMDCAELTSISIPEGVTNIGEGAFDSCTGLSSITIPDSVINIGEAAFAGCTGLSSITIPDSVTKIKNFTFANCSGLTSIMLPDSVKSIGAAVFIGCDQLRKVYFGGTEEQWQNVDIIYENNGNKALYDAEIIFGQSQAHTEHTWDAGEVTKEATFDDAGEKTFTCTVCGATKTEPIPKTSMLFACGVVDEKKGLDGSQVLWKLDSDGTLTISGAGEMKDYDYLFKPRWCEMIIPIKNVIIQNGVTSISDWAFNDCSDIMSVTIGNSVASIGNFAFSGCKELTNVTIPDSVKTIGNNAFSGCAGLTDITIPDSVESIGYQAFYGCTGLKDVYFIGSEQEWNAITIEENNECLTTTALHFIDSLIDAENAKEVENNVLTVPGMTAKDLTALAGDGAAIVKSDGSAQTGKDAVGSGMILTKPDGTKLTIVIKGDNDGDGKVSSADARLALRRSVSLEQFTDWQTAASLVGGGEKVTSADARLILRASVGLEDLAGWRKQTE